MTDRPATEIQASINFAASHDKRPEIYAHRPPDGEEARTSEPSRIQVRVEDVGGQDASLSLDVEGMAVVPLDTVVDFGDPDAITSTYYAACEASVAAATGAERVVAFDYNLRSAPRAEAGEPGLQRPVKFAHNDYTEASGPQRVRDLFPEEADQLLSRRFAVINVWRPMSHPAEDVPLGVCDARTIAPEHLLQTALKYSERTGEIYSLAYHPDQRWIYIPALAPTRALLLKCYDSAMDGRARFTAHAAFRDPTARPDAPARESVEVRTLAFF